MHKVKCVVCGEEFDRDKIEAVLVSPRRYAHATCISKERIQEIKQDQNEYDKTAQEYEELENYVRKLFGDNYIDVKVKRQIMEYRQNYSYTYTGMLKSLIWFYDIKKNPKDKANGGIAIIPWIYKDAMAYYYTLYVAEQNNSLKDSNDISSVTEVIIHSPRVEKKPRKLFNIEVDDEQE